MPFLFVCVTCEMDLSWQSVTGAAQRRRGRRLRAAWRHEQQSIAQALAAYTHHSAPRRPTMARARGEESEMHNATGQMTPPPRVASTEYYRMDDDRDVLAARPTPLVEVRPQPGVLRHTGAHIVDFSPFVQILDDPVPQMRREQVVEFMRKLDAPALDEQVTAVPKISLDRVSKRCPRPRTRRADQLVEVPTIVSYSSLQERTLQQIIDIPVPQGRVGRGGFGGLQGVSQRQGSTAFSGAHHVDIPVPHGRGLQGFLPGQGSTASSSSSHVRAGAVDEPFQGVFRTFPRLKKSARLGPHSGSELGADFTPWTPAAYAESMAGAYDESEAESEAEVVVEEGAVTRFAAGLSALAGLHEVPRAPIGTASAWVCPRRQVHFCTLMG